MSSLTVCYLVYRVVVYRVVGVQEGWYPRGGACPPTQDPSMPHVPEPVLHPFLHPFPVYAILALRAT